MAGLGLMNALGAYQDGVQWKANQERQKQAAADEAALRGADEAYGAVFKQSQDEWAKSGAPGTYKPSDETMFRAAEARGLALGKAGKWREFMQNEALVTKERIRARGAALQQFEQDGDAEALVRKVYPTIFDGRTVASTRKVQGADAVQGLPAQPDAIEVEFSDGQKLVKPIAEVVAGVKKMLVDPATFAEQESQANFLRVKADIEAGKQIKVAEARGDQARETEGVRQEGRRGLESLRQDGRVALAGVKLGGSLELAGVNNASDERIAAGRNATTLAAVDRRKQGGGSGGGAARGSGKAASGLQSTKVDSDGYVLGVFRDGQARRLTGEDGKPIRSGDWSKRVDSLAKTLRDAPGNFSKPTAELRKEAEAALAGNPPASGRPSLDSFNPQPGLGTAPASRPPLSNFMVK
jgi:hypothetical protein